MPARKKLISLATVVAAGAAAAVTLVPQAAEAKYKAPKPTPCSTATAFKSSKIVYSKNKEVASVQKLLVYINGWQKAVAKKNKALAIKSGVKYELYWQGVEVYVNHRSLPLYVDLETDSQFSLEDIQESAKPDWKKACKLVKRMGVDIDAAIALSKNGPKLSPIFDDLAKVRAVRANLNQARNALTAGDLPTARGFLATFAAGQPRVQGLITARSQRATDDINATWNTLAAALADPAATAASVNTPFLAFQSRYGFGVNVINAAARASDLHRTSFTDNDKTNLSNLNKVLVALNNSLSKVGVDPAAAAAGGATGPGSAFSKVQSALEVQARFIAVAPALRNALNAYATLVAGTPTVDQAVASANLVKDQIEISRQVLVGQFWSDPAVQAYLAGLPTS